MAKKLKIDFSKQEEVSPYLVDLREKKKEIVFSILPTSAFRKFSIVIGIIVFIFSLFFFISTTISQISDLEKELIETTPSDMEIFFQGVDYLKNLKIIEAEEKFNFAERFFSEKIEKIEKTNFLTKIFLKTYPRSKTGLLLLKIFRDSSKIGSFLTQNIEELPSLFELSVNEQKITTQEGGFHQEQKGTLPPEILDFDFLKTTDFLKKKTEKIYLLVDELEKDFSKLNPNYIPKNFQNSFILIRKEIPPLKKEISDFVVLLENLETIAGKNSFKRYLILFQNNNEIRPTGGFLGSFALIDFESGKIKNFEMPAGGTYDLVGGLKVRVAPPKPLLIAYPNWKFHDANWFPDWPASAQKLSWFYERSGGSTVDGVIAINAELISDLLGVIGEISLPQYQKIINQDNFILETQKIIEAERREASKEPKKFLVDLAPVLVKKILEQEPVKLFKIFATISQGLKEKKILLYFFDHKIEKFFAEKNWVGEIKKSPLDYLFVVATNVNGAKTEGVISQKISYRLEINEDGSMIGTLKIKRKHGGVVDDFFTGRKDLSWLRVYLPKGTVFLGGQGATKKEFPEMAKNVSLDDDLKKIEKEIIFDKFSGTRITEEFDKICLGNFLEIGPGEEKEISFKFLLPSKLDFLKGQNSYSLLVQKQPGRNSDFEAEIILPEEKNIVWSYPEDEIKKDGKIIKISSIINRDRFFAFVVE